MAKVKVKYRVELEQIIDWPDDELDNLSHESIVCSCEPAEAQVVDHNFELQEVTINGEIQEL